MADYYIATRIKTMEVIHIFGAAGSGTSTLGRYVSENSGYFFMDTDDYFWLPTDPPFTQKREKTSRIALMKADIFKHQKVVISGSLSGWGDELIPFFTIAVRLHVDTNIRIERIKNRERQRFNSRIDIGGDMHEQHCDFLEWAAAYDFGGASMRSKTEHDLWQKKLSCKKIDLDGTHALEDNFKNIAAIIADL